MKKYIIDTDLYIDFIRTGKYHSLLTHIYTNETPGIYCSSVVAQELLSGVVSEKGRQNVKTILSPFERVGRIITPDHRIWKEAGDVISTLRRKKPDLKSKLPRMINDALIAMSARSIGATIITQNASDFEAIKFAKKFSYIAA